MNNTPEEPPQPAETTKTVEIEMKFLPAKPLCQALLDLRDDPAIQDIFPVLSLYGIYPDKVTFKYIYQTYAEKKEEGRVRKSTDSEGNTTYEHTTKTLISQQSTTDMKEKVEITTSLGEEEYKKIVETLQGGSVEKIRITCIVPFDHNNQSYDMTIEIDLFLGIHAPLIFIEVENPNPDTISSHVFKAFIKDLKGKGVLGATVNISNRKLAANPSLVSLNLP